ncbi:MAG: hypothetical protein LBQ12_06130 [Deltaproteobacteria bacterium]|jgi:hypothetical protein|nr:hypothetical protein [Deltaproteobacteria bacterium]
MTVMYATEQTAAGRVCLKARKAAPRLAAGLGAVLWAARLADNARENAGIAESCGAAGGDSLFRDVILACRALMESRQALLGCMSAVRGPKSAFAALEGAAGRQPGLRRDQGWALAGLREALDGVRRAAFLFAGENHGWTAFARACARAGVLAGRASDVEAWAGEIGLDVPKFLRVANVAAEQASEAAAGALTDYEGFCSEFERFFGSLPGRGDA